MTKLNEMTTEHLGQDATDADLDQFKGWARELMARDGMSESDAIDTLWNDGDYTSKAAELGLA
jgi:hypothetical protein